MEAGSRTGSRYFEIMARQRGVDPAVLEPYLRQLRAVEEAQRRAAETAGDSPSRIEGAFAALRGGAIVAALAALTAPVVGAQREFDKLNASLVTATGSTDKAGVAFAALQAFAATTPFGLAESTEAFIKMRNMGLDPSERALRSYGNTAAAMGKSLEQMVEAVADAATGEFERLKEFGIKASQNGEKVTLTFKGTSTTIKNEAEAIEKYLAKIGEVDFAGAMIQRAATLDGAISQLGDSWESAMRAISAGGIGQAAQDGVVGLSASLNDLETILLAISEAADKQTEKLSAASTIHKALTTVFEAVSVLGVNVAYVFRQVGNEIGGLAAQATAAATGNFTQARLIGEQMKADAQRDRLEVDRQTAAILGAVEKAKKAAENAPKRAPGDDALAQFRIQREAEREGAEAAKRREKAAREAAEALKKEMGLIAELSGYNADFAEKRERLNDAYANGAITFAELGAAQAKLLSQQPVAKQAMSEQIKAQAESDKLYEQGINTAEQYRDSLLEQLGAQRQSNEVIGLSTVATAELQARRLWDAAALKEQTAAALEADEPGSRIAQIYREQAAALRDLAQAKGEGGRKQDATDVSRKELEELNKFLDPARAQTFGEALREAFGTAGESLSRLTGTLDGFGKRQAEITKHRETAEKNRGKGEFSEIKYLQTISELNKRQTQDQLASYGSMASAAAGFFGEQSRGYEALMAVSKVFHAAELAMTLAELVPKGIAAVLNQGTGDPYSAFGRMAAMAAIVTGLGVAIGGIGGGGPSLSESRQKAQGTGTVLGSDAKSESISRSLDLIKDATFQGLNISTGMLTALRNIESNITNFAEFAVKTTTLGDPIAYGSRGGAADFGNSAMGVFATGGFIGLALDKLTGGWVGKITGSVLNKLFGGKTTVEGTGFSVDKIDYASILAGGLNAMQYAEIKKEGGLFRSDKYSTQTKSLGEDGNRQFELVLTSLYQSVFEAGKLLGLGADSFSSQLDSFVVDIGKISLDGLDDEAIQKELEAVFSKVGDQLAEFGVAGLQQFQKVGEGYLETLTRVATNYQAVSVVTESLGMVFGDVGTASIAARERLIDLVGGLGEFTSSAEQFMSDFYTDKERADALRARIQPTLDQFGIQTGADDTLQQFRDVVKSLKLETADGAAAFATLMQIAPAVKQIADVDASKFEERMELEIKLMDMLGDKSSALAASRAIELAGLDASLRPLQQRIYALEDEAAALEVTNSLLDIQAKIYELTGNKAGAAAVLVQQQANALAALDPALRGATQQLWSLEAAAKATEKLKSDASTLLGNVDGAFSALERVVRREKSLVDERIAAEKKIVDKHQELSKSLRGTLDSMIEPTQLLGNRQGAQAQIQAALAIAKAGGTLPEAETLKKALSIVSKESSELYATQQDYLRDFYTTQNDIAALADITDSTLSIEEKSLKLLEEEGKRLDSILTSAQQQIDVLKGIDTSVLSVADAIAALGLSIASAKGNAVVASAGAVNAQYQSVLGRAPDAAGMQFWQDQAAKGVSQTDILNAIANSAEANIKSMYQATLGRAADAGGLQFWVDQVNKGTSYADIQRALEQSGEKLRGFAVGTNYVPTNMPAMIHEGERIIPAADNRELMRRLSNPEQSNAVLAAAVERLTREVEGLRTEARATATHTEKTARLFDRVIEGNEIKVKAEA